MTQRLLAHVPWTDAAAAAAAGRLVIVPTGATEAHGPHLPLDTDTHQAETVALALADRVDALVAPAVSYGYSTTFSAFSGTVSLAATTYEQVVFEVGDALIRGGFHRVLLLNGNRPNGTANDVVARRLIDAHGANPDLRVLAVSYWEPAAARLHALRSSEVGGMGHADELETSLQLALRPELVHLDRLAGVEAPLVQWDLVAPGPAGHAYGSPPTPERGHPAIFGDPSVASAAAGRRFLEVIVEELAALVETIQPAYDRRRTVEPSEPDPDQEPPGGSR